MAWRGFGRGYGRGYGMWPGRGPFSYLPPWQRPGWLFGRGACWWLLPYIYMYGYPQYQYSSAFYGTPYLPPTQYYRR